MSNYSSRSYKLTKNEYNYLLAAIPKKVGIDANGNHFVIADSDGLPDLLARMKGLAENWDEGMVETSILLKCFNDKSLEPFRKAYDLPLLDTLKIQSVMDNLYFKSTTRELEKHNGIVNIIRQLTKDEADIEDVGMMYLCKTKSGEEIHVFSDELLNNENVNETTPKP